MALGGRLSEEERAAEAVESEQGWVGRKRVRRTATVQKMLRREEGMVTHPKVLRVKKVNHIIEVAAVVLEGKCKQSVVS